MARRVPSAWWLLTLVPLVAAVLLLVMLLPDRARPAATALGPRPTGSLNVLIIGRDARALGPVKGEGRLRNPREDRSHSDVVVIAHFNFDLGRVSLYGIPRDLLVHAPGITADAGPLDFENMEKLTHVHAIGGPKLLRRTLEHLLGITIHRHIAFDFDTFRMVLNLLRPFLTGSRVGGVALTDYQHALMLARRREGLADDDIDRSRNNVRIVGTVLARTWWLADSRIGRGFIHRLLGIVGEDTDLTETEVRQVIWGLKQAGWNPRRTRAAVLVGEGMDVYLNRYSTVLSCYLPAHDEVRRQVKRLIEDDDEVKAIDYMTREDYDAPGYLYEPRPAPPAPDTTPPADSAGQATILLELQRSKPKEDSPPMSTDGH